MKKYNITTNLGLKIIAFIFAVFLWFIVVNLDNPVGSSTFRDIPVQILNEDIIKSAGEVYQVEGDQTVTVVVYATREVRQKLTSDNIVATADIKQIDSTGRLVPIEVSISGFSGENITAEAVPRNLTIQREKSGKKVLPLTVDTDGIGLADGYMLGDATVKPDQVTITGAESVLAQVDRAVAQTGDVDGISEDTVLSANLVLYDANGNEQWKKSVGGSKYDWYNSVIEITDGTYIAVGTILSTDVVDKNGNNIGHGYNFNCLFSNNYVVAMEGIIGRYDLNGNEISLNTTGKANTSMNIVIKGIDKMSDGNYIITGKKIVQGNDDGNMEDYLGSGTAIKYNLQGQEITECSTALYTSEYYGLGGSIAPSNYKDIHLQMTIWNGVIENNTSGYTFYGGSFSWAGGASIWKTTSTLENVMLRK